MIKASLDHVKVNASNILSQPYDLDLIAMVTLMAIVFELATILFRCLSSIRTNVTMWECTQQTDFPTESLLPIFCCDLRDIF